MSTFGATTHTETAPAPRAHVLLVEDERELAEELAEALSSAGISVTIAASAAQAVHHVERDPELDTVVTDIMLGDVSGLELLRKLAKVGRGRQIRSIVCSGYASVDHILAALRLGVVDFLPKPVMPDELVDAVRRAITQRNDTQDEGPELSRRGVAQLLLNARKKRDSIFGAEMFEDPAWNMMLDLYASTLSGRPVTVSDLCLASGTSATTALRRMTSLVELGLIERVPDPHDRRRVLVRQTERGREAMDRFSEWLRGNVVANKAL